MTTEQIIKRHAKNWLTLNKAKKFYSVEQQKIEIAELKELSRAQKMHYKSEYRSALIAFDIIRFDLCSALIGRLIKEYTGDYSASDNKVMQAYIDKQIERDNNGFYGKLITPNKHRKIYNKAKPYLFTYLEVNRGINNDENLEPQEKRDILKFFKQTAHKELSFLIKQERDKDANVAKNLFSQLKIASDLLENIEDKIILEPKQKEVVKSIFESTV
jgi:hypothetical protein